MRWLFVGLLSLALCAPAFAERPRPHQSGGHPQAAPARPHGSHSGGVAAAPRGDHGRYAVPRGSAPYRHPAPGYRPRPYGGDHGRYYGYRGHVRPYYGRPYRSYPSYRFRGFGTWGYDYYGYHVFWYWPYGYDPQSGCDWYYVPTGRYLLQEDDGSPYYEYSDWRWVRICVDD